VASEETVKTRTSRHNRRSGAKLAASEWAFQGGIGIDPEIVDFGVHGIAGFDF